MRTAFFADAERFDAGRFRATLRACFDSAFFDAARLPSCFSALRTARARLADGFLRERPALVALLALERVSFEAPLGAGSFTPARRAFDNPIAIACSGERAPCLPSRT